MDSLAKMLKYPTQIEKTIDNKISVIHMLGYGQDAKIELSQRQLDMLKYHTSIEQPSFIETLKVELGLEMNKLSLQNPSIMGSCSPSSPLSFSITDIQ